MALIFNQAGQKRQFANPYGVKFVDSYFESAKAHFNEGNLAATRTPLSSSNGLFVVSCNVRSMDTVRVAAVMLLDTFIDLQPLSELTPKNPSLVNLLTSRLAEGLVVHTDVHELIRILNPDLVLSDNCFVSGGMISVNLDLGVLQAGLGSTFGGLPRSLLVDAFSDLAIALGCSFEPITISSEDAGFVGNYSDSRLWFNMFKIPSRNH